MRPNGLSRREMLERCLATGGLLAAGPITGAEALALWEREVLRRPTRTTGPGPFYKADAPRAETLTSEGGAGLPLAVSGRIVDTRGENLEDAVLEVWHADHGGRYDMEGFHGRGVIPVRGGGAYRFQTLMPGDYGPGRHIHYRVTAPGHRTLVTQLLFAPDPPVPGAVESSELVRPVRLTKAGARTQAEVTFELCLARS
jgi:protocatechuate 3,4-dioxygenase beta subunit